MFGSAGARVLPCIINIEAKQQVDLYTDQYTFHHTQRNMGTFWQALKELEYCIKSAGWKLSDANQIKKISYLER